jgi:hypothetical protein
VTLPRMEYIKDTLGVLNSPNNGILIGIGRRPAGLEERGINDRTKQKRRCYQRRPDAPIARNRPTLTGAGGSARSGSAGVGSRGSRSAGEATPHLS